MNDRVFVGLGSNMGDRQALIESAIHAIRRHPQIRLVQQAGLYSSEPVHVEEQPEFLNTVIEIETDCHPKELLGILKGFEREIGRQKRARWGPREIDLDLLLYGDRVLSLPDLNVPHPEMHRRRFVLVPLAEIAPDVIHPLLKISIWSLLQSLEDEKGVWPFPSESQGHRNPQSRAQSSSPPSKKRFWLMHAPM